MVYTHPLNDHSLLVNCVWITSGSGKIYQKPEWSFVMYYPRSDHSCWLIIGVIVIIPDDWQQECSFLMIDYRSARSWWLTTRIVNHVDWQQELLILMIDHKSDWSWWLTQWVIDFNDWSQKWLILMIDPRSDWS